MMKDTDWRVSARFPRYDDRFVFEVWDGRAVRAVRRIGNNDHTRLAPGTLVYVDCTHPVQNALCDESRIAGWRIRSDAAAP